MGGTEPLVTRLGAEDADAGLALSDEVGWNQTRDDWQAFLTSGLVLAIRDARRVIATAALLPMPPLAWVSLVIVTEEHRRRGLAKTLVTRCLDAAAARGLQAHLDATPAGEAVYRQIGFVPTGLTLHRLRRPGVSRRQRAPAVPAATPPIEHLAAADAAALGAPRRSILDHLVARPGSRILANDGAVALVRDGRQARHVGPVIAADPAAATALLGDMMEMETAPLLIDVSDAHPSVAAALSAAGFVFERPFARMRVGAPRANGVEAALIASAGPEFG